jgi:uncharacterized protein (DUF2147 family)
MLNVVRSLAVVFLATGSAMAQSGDPTGTWLNADKDGIVQLGDCGQLRGQPASGTLCGNVAWIRDAVDRTTGRPPVDGKNIDPALRNRPIVGLPVLTDLRPSSTRGRWDGRIYNIDDGKTYTARVTLTADNQLQVEGCVLLICRGEAWTRQALPATQPARPATPAARPPALTGCDLIIWRAD